MSKYDLIKSITKRRAGMSKSDVTTTLSIEFENEGMVQITREPTDKDDDFGDEFKYAFRADDLTYAEDELQQLINVIRAFTE